jgi:acyl dehydratase
MNPLHADPGVARDAGFDRPILHGLCTMGIACRALIQSYCDDDPDALNSMYVRFSQPVFPGETIRVESREDMGVIRFRARTVERDVVVLDRGEAILARWPTN